MPKKWRALKREFAFPTIIFTVPFADSFECEKKRKNSDYQPITKTHAHTYISVEINHNEDGEEEKQKKKRKGPKNKLW